MPEVGLGALHSVSLSARAVLSSIAIGAGHYDVYQGGKDYDNVLRVEVEFLRRHAALTP